MKQIYFSLLLLLALGNCTDPNGVSNALQMSPGTLGVSSEITLDCSETDVGRVLDNLTDSSEFTIPLADSAAVNWWSEGGFDFLNYRCLKIRRSYYMISLNSSDLNETTVAIRSVYTNEKGGWKHAKKFTPSDHYHAKKAMEYLEKNMPSCQ